MHICTIINYCTILNLVTNICSRRLSQFVKPQISLPTFKWQKLTWKHVNVELLM